MIKSVFVRVYFHYFRLLVLLVLLMLLKTFFVCPPACRRRLFLAGKWHSFFCVPSGLPQAPFFGWKLTFLKKWYFLKWEKACFLLKIDKNTRFELLEHHHELNQKKLILLKLFMLKIDSTMLKLWSNPFFSCIFWPFSTPCTFLNV